MLRTLSFTGSLTILPLIDAADEDEVGGSKSDVNKTNLSNPSALKKFTRAGYLTFKDTKRGGGNTKKGVEVAKGSDYLISAIKKVFNHL